MIPYYLDRHGCAGGFDDTSPYARLARIIVIEKALEDRVIWHWYMKLKLVFSALIALGIPAAIFAESAQSENSSG